MLTAANLLEAIPGSQPTGDSLVNDQAVFLLEEEFDRLINQQGSSADSSAIRDWELIARQASEVLERSKHLQIAFYWAAARLVCDGVVGLTSGVELLLNLCVRYWPELHPRPAANDPIGKQRITWLNDLGNSGTYSRLVRERTLFVPEDGPAVTLNDVAVAEQMRGAPEGVVPRSSAEIGTLFAQHAAMEPDARQVVGQLRQAATSVGELMAGVRRLTDGKASLQLEPLKRLLDAAVKVLAGNEAAAARSDVGATTAENPTSRPSSLQSASSGGMPSANTLDTARASLRQLIAFFEKVEPSSPVPLLLRRAERLIGKSFVQCLEDLGGSMEAVTQVAVGQTEHATE